MVFKVLIVDDSSFFQARLKEIINEHPELEVVGLAANGQEAVDLARSLKPDIISMDYEMPYMDGVTAVRLILSERKVPIVMFSSLTYEGAKVTLDALAAGAVDFIPKNFAEIAKNSVNLKRRLHDTLLTFAKKFQQSPSNFGGATPAQGRVTSSHFSGAISSSPSVKAVPQPAAVVTLKTPVVEAKVTSKPPLKGRIKLIVIGTSTGGPIALAEVLSPLTEHFSVPIVVVQHMPPNFTRALSERLNTLCHLHVKEAETGDALLPGRVLIAPGGAQLLLDKNNRSVRILPGDDRMNYKPSVDITFASAANVFGASTLGVVLTGMGADGCEGARLIKQQGGFIWGQNEASCVVYGMPRAVAKANLTDEVLALPDIATRLSQEF